MTYTVVPDVDAGASFTEAMWDTYIKDNLNAGLARPLAHTQLGAPAASLTLSSIPGTFGSLLCAWSARSDFAGNNHAMGLRFNASGGTGYDYQRVFTQATTGAAFALGDSFGPIALIPANTAVGNSWGTGFVFIPNYANANVQKTWYSVGSAKWGTVTNTYQVHAYTGIQDDTTAAITSLYFLPDNSANFITGTRFTLYGLGLV